MSEQLRLLPGYLSAHLELTLFALLVGAAVSIPAGVLVHRVRWLEQPVLGVASVIQTIPSLALLAVMVPLLAVLGVDSIGYLPAFLALVLYSVLPLLRNTVVGLASVEPSVVEAARGVGMAPGEQLRRVELPLALPVIIAGARTSTVWTVGMATLSTPVGAPSLGNFIFSGLQTRNYSAVLVGCVGAAALALVLDGVVRALGLGVERRRRPVVVAALVVLGLLYAYAAAGMVRDRMADGPRPVVIGAKTFTEQYVLSEIIAGQIQRATGEPTRVMQSLGSSVVFDALRSEQIDLYVDYSGTIWANVMHRDTVPSRAEVLNSVGAFLRERYGIELIAPLGFENAYALAMRRDRARELGVRRVGDLGAHAPRMTIGGDYEFFGRPEWARVRQTYHLEFAGERSMDPSLMYQAAKERQVDVISAFSTDGRIVAFDLVVLEDDRQAIPPYDAILLASPKLVRERPEVVHALRQLSGSIDADRMRRMNLAVDQAGRSPRTVAEEFLDGQQAQ